jgi:hypothetical protein
MQAETLMKEQSSAVFAGVQEHLRSGQYTAALRDLESLEGNPVVESHLLDLLKELIQSRQVQEAAQAESAVDELEAELAGKSERIAELEEQIRAIVAAGDSRLARELQGRVDALNTELKAVNAEAERLGTAVRDLQAERDALAVSLQDARAERDALAVSLQDARAARSETLEQGRENALRDVMTFLRFLSGSGETDGDTEDRLLALARQDPLFRAATREIQILIAGGGSPGELASPFSFLGIVSSVASDRVVIEAMVDLDISVGSIIQIRHISDLDREITIAEGTVQQLRGGKITASFKPVDTGAQGPAVRDTVYVVLEEK